MRTKSAYKTPAESPAPIPRVEVSGEPAAGIGVSVETTDPVLAAAEPSQPVDEATVALMRQLESLRQSEELQRQYAMHQHAVQASPRAQPMTRVEFLRSQGLTKAEAEFFDGNEQMMAHQQEASEAAAEALAAGCERDSPAFFSAVEEGFAKRLDALNQQPAAPPAAFSQPRSVSPSPAAPPDRSSMYSAPVSRAAPPSGYREPSPSQVKLSPEEMQIAAASGISHTEYARHKLRMMREKATGERQ